MVISSVNWDKLLFLNAVGFFIYKDWLLTIGNLVTKKLFIKTISIKTFRFKEIISVFRDGAWFPVIRKEGGSHTMWFYLLVDGKFIPELITPNCPY